MVGRGSLLSAAGHADALKNHRVSAILKAAVAAGTTTGAHWASELIDYRVVENGFLESLRSVGVFDHLLGNGMRKVPLRSRLILASSATIGEATVEALPKAVATMSFDASDLTPTKVAAVVAVSSELAKTSLATALIGQELRAAVVAATDAVFLEA